MTTNVFDQAAGLLATDSRWSQRHGKWLIYVDDTECHKIEVAADHVFMFAGKGRQIEEWKLWVRNGADKLSIPSFDGLSICSVQVSTRLVNICEGMPIKEPNLVVGGSGWRFAYPCWTNNRDPKRSVETAKAFDPATGGNTRYFCLKSNSHNLEASVFGETTIDGVGKAISTRGMIMDVGNSTYPTGVPFKLTELAASNDEVKDLQQKFASGELSADAPSDTMEALWTDDQKERVTAALAKIFNW